MLSIILRKYRVQQSAAMARNCRVLLARPVLAPFMPHRVSVVAGLHQSASRRIGINMDDARKDLDAHRAQAYAKAEEFATKTRALREAMRQKLQMASPANQSQANTQVDNYSRSLLELQQRVEQHARHVDEEVTMLDAQLSDDIVQEADDVRMADRRLEDMLARANRIVDEDTERLHRRLQGMTTGSGLLEDDVELGTHDWHLRSQAESAHSGQQEGPSLQEAAKQMGGKLRQGLADNVEHPTRQYARGMYDDVADAVEDVTHKARRTTSSMGKAAGEMGEKMAELGGSAKETVKENVREFKRGAQVEMEGVEDAVGTPFRDIKEKVKDIGSNVRDTVKENVREFKRGAQVEMEGVEGAVGTPFRDIKEKVKDIGSNVRDTVKENVREFKRGAQVEMEGVEDAIGAPLKNIEEKARDIGSNVRDTAQRVKEQVQEGASRVAGTFEEARSRGSVGGKRAGEALQDAADTVKQKARDSYDAVTARMPNEPTRLFEEKMGSAYDMLKDGMDMTGLSEAKARTQPAVDSAKQTAESVKEQVRRAGQTVGAATSEAVPLGGLQGVAAYDLLEHMEEMQDHPAELNSLRSAEINMYGNDRKLREAVFTWSEDAAMQQSGEAAPPKHDIRTADEFDDEALNALLDEAEDFGAVIHENPRDMLRRKPGLR
ncbi:hypothetical protein SYNPS1DRAFT_21694 [Syncephalis pseudoplumigaleata]|uniref:Uncharacterized protein n=1 Tax=Syncephalis pseudoplumigaleata TaxID=1712513 RepID=A0A4P9Z272_9FUNG|nr:hypothetical protein SYNPS1DRAFT_21694 [Syncephalis pseudoplumigaleata]|eukprot:RKP26574.1 hypothetical protein SYNPS1DRAFT_21694 [Syncephalis pseudoplumigaleata]